MKHCIYLLLVLIIIASCSKDNQTTDDSTTNLVIKMTDNPTDLQQVNVDIQKVILKGEDETQEIELGTNAGVYDLLSLQNGVEVILAEGPVEITTLKQIRLVLGSDNSVMQDGEMLELKTPSAEQSGLKIKLSKPLDPVDEIEILLDFDAEKSVKQLGNGDFMLKPVIKVME